MLAHRLEGIPPTIFTTMSALAVRTQSVNLGQGFPDVDGPPEVIARAVHALESGANQYAPGPGIPALRQAVAAHQLRHYGLELDPDSQVVVTTGCTEGIAAALLGLVNPGDEVVVLEPYYDSYVAMIQMAGGVRRPVTLRAPEFRLDADELRAAVTPRTRFVLLNSPHNPTGTVLTRDELQAVADVAIEHDLVVITDEVYEHLVYDESEHVPIATLPGMFERTLTLSSAGKSYSFTGWKVGWATGPAALVGALLAAKQWLTFTSGSPLQPVVALLVGGDRLPERGYADAGCVLVLPRLQRGHRAGDDRRRAVLVGEPLTEVHRLGAHGEGRHRREDRRRDAGQPGREPGRGAGDRHTPSL
jgi:N-succinyldiaminopimelate aminotransferase